MAFIEPTAGNEISQRYTGNVQFNNVSVSAAGLPDSPGAKLAAGTPVTVPVTIKNNGAQAEEFFIDPRLNQTAVMTLAGQDQISGVGLPLTGSEPDWFVPTEASSASTTSAASLPVMFDWGPFQGDPDISSSPPGPGPLCSTSESASYSPPGGTIQNGF